MSRFEADGFLLTRHWRDTSQGIELTFWASSPSGPLRIVITEAEAVAFCSRDAKLDPNLVHGLRRKPLELSLLDGRPADALYFRNQRDLVSARQTLQELNLHLCESDIKPTDRYLMERFITGALRVSGEALERPGYLELINPYIQKSSYSPDLSFLALDVETAGLDGELYSIAVHNPDQSLVFMVGQGNSEDCEIPLRFFPDEKALLFEFFRWLRSNDPDLILGWNIVGFDIDYLERRCRQLEVPFIIGRGEEQSTVLGADGEGQVPVARIGGRVALDGIATLRTATWNLENYELDAVAQTFLGRGKLIAKQQSKIEEINRLFREDKQALAAYNLEDCRLVAEIFEATDLINFVVQRSQLTGLALDRPGGSVAAFDNLYLPRLHRKGHVAPDVGSVPDSGSSPGGYVMDSEPGLYDNVLVLDFKSLYPSIIRTFKIDPLGLAVPDEDDIAGFQQASFSRHNHILPELIDTLWQARDQAKRQNNTALSQAIKIIMNSFYGVLGASGCRFFDPRLASNITRRGHDIIIRSREFIEGQGHRVIYGDTDSLFVLLGAGHTEDQARVVGNDLVRGLNKWWKEAIEQEFRLASYLEVEFETHYIRFVMPTVRGDHKGTKKRYAGYVRKDSGDYEVIFKGLESVRSDWTPLAREFQRELYRRVFFNEPFKDYMQQTASKLMEGQLDHLLVYRKRIRRKLQDYKRNVPPHVQAARKQTNPDKWISYIITRNGPEPLDNNPSAPDYQHYMDRQLAPAADGILQFLGTSFEAITTAQLSMF
ncbi:MAG: DNA polymerase II [Gammaproteobacteria bacterium]|nr:DNA polymerase II [Gammaproteobacteria bacterium]